MTPGAATVPGTPGAVAKNAAPGAVINPAAPGVAASLVVLDVFAVPAAPGAVAAPAAPGEVANLVNPGAFAVPAAPGAEAEIPVVPTLVVMGSASIHPSVAVVIFQLLPFSLRLSRFFAIAQALFCTIRSLCSGVRVVLSFVVLLSSVSDCCRFAVFFLNAD